MMAEYNRRLEKIEEALGQVFPPQASTGWVAALTGEAGLSLSLNSVDKINAPGWALLNRGGKRWRPLVLMMAHDLCGGSCEDLAALGCLVELPHNGSLIVDDIEDKAQERRGGAAIHLIYGVDMAINTGNFLYFEPTYLLENLDLSDGAKLKITQHYLRVMRCLHLGQGLDIQWHNDHGFLPKQEEYLQMCRFKTGALARLAAEVGALAAGAGAETVNLLGKIWEEVGVGFQILDDVRNLKTGNPGKMRGDDVVEGKKSLPVLCHGELSPDGGASLLRLFSEVALARESGRIDQAGIEASIGLMESSGALVKAQEIAEAMLSRAQVDLGQRFPEGSAKQGMLDMIESFWEGLRT